MYPDLTRGLGARAHAPVQSQVPWVWCEPMPALSAACINHGPSALLSLPTVEISIPPYCPDIDSTLRMRLQVSSPSLTIIPFSI